MERDLQGAPGWACPIDEKLYGQSGSLSITGWGVVIEVIGARQSFLRTGQDRSLGGHGAGQLGNVKGPGDHLIAA